MKNEASNTESTPMDVKSVGVLCLVKKHTKSCRDQNDQDR